MHFSLCTLCVQRSYTLPSSIPSLLVLYNSSHTLYWFCSTYPRPSSLGCTTGLRLPLHTLLAHHTWAVLHPQLHQSPLQLVLLFPHNSSVSRSSCSFRVILVNPWLSASWSSSVDLPQHTHTCCVRGTCRGSSTLARSNLTCVVVSHRICRAIYAQ